MKTYVLNILLAAVTAESGVTCNPDGDEWSFYDGFTAYTLEQCKAACENRATDEAAALDVCCKADHGDDFFCDFYSRDAGSYDIRETAEGEYTSWAW